MPTTLSVESRAITVLLDGLKSNFSNKFYRIWDFDQRIAAVFIRDKLMLRSAQNLTVTVIVEHRETIGDVIVTIIASGGRSGLFRLDILGSENAAESWAEKEITNLLQRSNYSVVRLERSPSTRPWE